MSDVDKGSLTIGEPTALGKTWEGFRQEIIALEWRLGHKAPIL